MLQAWDPRPRGLRTFNLVSSCCPRPHDSLFQRVLIRVLEDCENNQVLIRTYLKWGFQRIYSYSFQISNSHVLMRTGYEDFIGSVVLVYQGGAIIKDCENNQVLMRTSFMRTSLKWGFYHEGLMCCYFLQTYDPKNIARRAQAIRCD